MRPIILLTLLLFSGQQCLGAQAPPAATEAGAPKLSITISLERQTIREDDAVQVQVWLANDGERDLTELRLHVAAPSFLRWQIGSCQTWRSQDYQGAATNPHDLGPLPRRAVRQTEVCLKSASDIAVGDYNLLFTFAYAWQEMGAERRAFLPVEKPLKVSLLGSDDVAGIPLSLAGFIVPGLFFWLVVGWFKVSWLPWKAEGVALGDKLIYSIVVSVVILVLGSWLKLIDLSAGVSLTKMGQLALAGALCGMGAVLIDYLLNHYRRNKLAREQQAMRAKQIKLGENQDQLLDKLLDSYPSARKPKASLRLKNGEELIGSLARKDEGVAGLVGWFQIQPAAGSPQAARLAELAAAGKWKEVLAFARQNKLSLQIRDPIKKVKQDNSAELLETAHRTLAVNEIKAEPNVQEGQSQEELITIVAG